MPKSKKPDHGLPRIVRFAVPNGPKYSKTYWAHNSTTPLKLHHDADCAPTCHCRFSKETEDARHRTEA